MDFDTESMRRVSTSDEMGFGGILEGFATTRRMRVMPLWVSVVDFGLVYLKQQRKLQLESCAGTWSEPISPIRARRVSHQVVQNGVLGCIILSPFSLHLLLVHEFHCLHPRLIALGWVEW